MLQAKPVKCRWASAEELGDEQDGPALGELRGTEVDQALRSDALCQLADLRNSEG